MHSWFDELSFRKTIIISAVTHVVFILLFTVKAVFFPSELPEYLPVMKVDIVGLPQKRDPEEKIAPIAEPASKAVPEPIKPKPQTKTDTKDILEKFKKDTKSKPTKEEKIKDILEKFKNEQAKPTSKPIAGNRVADGNALKGLEKLDFDRYAGMIDVHVKNNWALPEWMLSQNLRAEINVKFDKNGQLLSKTFLVKSGSSDFDSYVEKAIENSIPFPPPPEKLIDLFEVRGITFAFPN